MTFFSFCRPFKSTICHQTSRRRRQTGTRIWCFRFWILPEPPALFPLDKSNVGSGSEIVSKGRKLQTSNLDKFKNQIVFVTWQCCLACVDLFFIYSGFLEATNQQRFLLVDTRFSLFHYQTPRIELLRNTNTNSSIWNRIIQVDTVLK